MWRAQLDASSSSSATRTTAQEKLQDPEVRAALLLLRERGVLPAAAAAAPARAVSFAVSAAAAPMPQPVAQQMAFVPPSAGAALCAEFAALRW